MMQRESAPDPSGFQWRQIGMRFAHDRLDARVFTHARDKPENIAVICGSIRMTWRQLDEAAHGLAAWLSARGLRAGHRIGWLARNGAEFPVLLIAAWRLRLCVVGFNWRLSEPELRTAIGNVGPDLVVVDEAFAGLLPDEIPELTTGFAFFDAAATVERVSYDMPQALDPAAILFSSGTSGRPRALLYSRAAFERQICGPTPLDFRDSSRLMVVAPQFHVAGWIWTACALAGGWPQVLLPKADAGSMLASVQRERVTHAQWLPSMLHAALAEHRARPLDLSSLRMIAYGASPISPALLDAVTEAFGCEFCQVYGLTEAMGAVGHLPPQAHRRGAGYDCASRVYPNPDVQVRVVNEARGEMPEGAAGEIEVRLLGDAPCYIGHDGAASVAQPDGWIATGDIGVWENAGLLRILGRKDDMIITGGENVYPAEVEGVIAGFDDVDEVAVFGREDAYWGRVVAAAIVLHPGRAMSARQIIEQCRVRLAHYKVPRHVLFINRLPRNSAGKIVYSELSAISVIDGI